MVYSQTRPCFEETASLGSEPKDPPGAAKCPEPLCPTQALPASARPFAKVEEHCLFLLAPMGSCDRPNPSRLLRTCLVQRVFAGCCQPLLGDGPSRRYLCKSFPKCLGLSRGGSQGAHTRFFPHDIGLPHGGPCGSAHTKIRSATSKRGGISQALPFLLIISVQAFRSACHSDRSHHSDKYRRAAVAFSSGQNVLRFPPSSVRTG